MEGKTRLKEKDAFEGGHVWRRRTRSKKGKKEGVKECDLEAKSEKRVCG